MEIIPIRLHKTTHSAISRRENDAYIGGENLKPRKNQNKQNKFCVPKQTISPSIGHVWFNMNF